MSILLLLFIALSFTKFKTINVNANNTEKDVLTQEEHLSYLEEALSSSTIYSSSIVEYHSYITSYFDNLTYNLGMNYKGSCGYVAIGMLLSYYDSFLDDNIIPEQYDISSNGYDGDIITRRNSPGILRDIIANPNFPGNSSYGYYLNANEYYSYINSIAEISLHAKLIMLGAERGYYDFSDNTNPAGTNFRIRYNILNDYFQNILGYSTSDYSINYINKESNPNMSNDVRQFTIEKIQNGQPVLLSIGGNDGGHVVIAYDYDESLDKLYCHFGWGANKTHITIESEDFTTYKTALSINFNFQHTHSNNYGITTINNNIPTTSYYCYDNDLLTLIIHNYTYDYVNMSSSNHIAFCKCGKSELQAHNFISNVCEKCGCIHTHQFNQWIYLNNSSHIEKCECGKSGSITRRHAIKSSDVGKRYVKCIECNYLLDMNKDKALISYNSTFVQLVTINGSYILPSGVVVLADKDINDYFTNSLIFYKKNEISQFK